MFDVQARVVIDFDFTTALGSLLGTDRMRLAIQWFDPKLQNRTRA